MKQVTFIVPRDSADESTFAVVRAFVDDPTNGKLDMRVLTNFKAGLKLAVTKWIKQASAGKDMWEYSNGTFNVGDLSTVLDDRDLVACLASEHIHNMEIEVHSVNVPSCLWTFDETLAHPYALKADVA